jgi:hypothetical protein
MWVRLERRQEPLLPRRKFALRMLRFSAFAIALLGGALMIGIWGYEWFEGLSLVDAFLNAAMLLGGMGPATELKTSGGKWFAGVYALFAGIVFLSAVGVFLTPLLHRAQHRFHLQVEDEADRPD